LEKKVAYGEGGLVVRGWEGGSVRLRAKEFFQFLSNAYPYEDWRVVHKKGHLEIISKKRGVKKEGQHSKGFGDRGVVLDVCHVKDKRMGTLSVEGGENEIGGR